MASKRKLKEKKKRAAQRQQVFEIVRAKQVADRLLGIKPLFPKPKGWKLCGTEDEELVLGVRFSESLAIRQNTTAINMVDI